MALPRFPTLPIDGFTELAGGQGGAAPVGHLADAQLPIHLARLELIRREALARFPGGYATARFDESLALLALAQQSDSEAARQVLAAPNVGAWTARCAELVCGAPSVRTPAAGAAGPAQSEDPDRVRAAAVVANLSHLAAIAAACAVRAGVSFDAQVPAVCGHVLLPTVGLVPAAARGAGSWARISLRRSGLTVRTDDGTVRLDGPLERETHRWWPVRQLCATADGKTLRVDLDDLDGYLFGGGLEPERLDGGGVRRLSRLLAEAWQVLVRRHPGYAAGIEVALRCLVPLPARSGGHSASAASRHAFGALGLTMPADATALAATLLHETQHMKLNGLLDLVDLHTADSTPRYRAPWRDDPRPLEGLMHGTYAFAGVADFWRVERTTDGPSRALAAFEFCQWRAAVEQALGTVLGSGRLTYAGAVFFEGLRRRVERWREEPVPAESAELAADAAADATALWRLRNRAADGHAVVDLADRYAAEQPPGALPPLSVRAGSAPRQEQPRQALRLLRVRAPAQFAALVADAGSGFDRDGLDVDDVGPAWLAAADMAHVAGAQEAEGLYRSALRADPDRVQAWAGLALATCRLGAPALSAQLELTYAVHRRLRATGRHVDPVQLAEWLNSAPGRAGQLAGDSMSNSTR